MRLRLRRKRRSHLRIVPLPAAYPEARWAMDFIHDMTVDGKPFRCLNVIDIFSRKIVGKHVDRRITNQKVIDAIDCMALKNGGYPEVITCDNGPEFTSLVTDQWAQKHNIRLDFIRSGTPTENGFVESYHACLRDEVLFYRSDQIKISER